VLFPKALPIVCLVLLPLRGADALTFSLWTPKREYLRYELVPLEARIEEARGVPVPGLCPEARIYTGGSLVDNRLGRTRLEYDETRGVYKGAWPIPYNPALGEYKIEVVVPLPDEGFTLRNSVRVLIRGRPVPGTDTSICAMTIEAQTDMTKHSVSDPFNGGWDWRNFTTWADLLCANTILYSVGWTIEGKVTAEDPWLAEGPAAFSLLAEEAHRKGFKFGGWIGTFLVWGEPRLGLGYDYSWEYKDGRLRRNHHVRIDDKKRVADVAKLARKLEADPNVDFVGFDYIRPGAGGLEMVEDFVESLAISTPSGWEGMTEPQKMRWLGQIVWEGKDTLTCARWDWWKAHKSAGALAEIIKRSEIRKPVWVFLLGWDKGHEHGQDPLMMNDAGADFCAVMLYESTARQEKAMIAQWSEYLRGDEVNLVVGEAVDWELMGKSREPEAPQEFAIRLSGGLRGLSRSYPAQGLFWHDLTRTHWGSPGPYSRIEWVNAGAAAFTRLREERGEIPFRTRVVPGRKETRVVIENLSDRALEDVRVTLIPTPGVALTDARTKRVPEIEAKSNRSVFFGLRPDSRSMVAFKIECGGAKGVDFEYYPNPYRNRPFREDESVHAGGDVLVVSPATSEAYSVGVNLRASSYSCNRMSLESLPVGVVGKYRWIVMIGQDLRTRPALGREIREYLTDGGSAVFVACQGLDSFGITGSESQGSYKIVDRTSIPSIVPLIESLH
jgi:hypothetical protein